MVIMACLAPIETALQQQGSSRTKIIKNNNEKLGVNKLFSVSFYGQDLQLK
jgi:hypothetical protein